jgi:signal transduction histidine kinase
VEATLARGLGFGRGNASRAHVALGLGAACIAATAVTAWAVARSPILLHPTEMAFWDGALVLAWIGSGIYIWWQRPASRLGPLLTAFGFLISGFSLSASGNAVVYTLGMVVWAGFLVGFAYVCLCFPSGRLESGLERWFVTAFALAAALVWGISLTLAHVLPTGGSRVECGSQCPHNPIELIGANAGIATALHTASSVVFTIGAIGLAMLLFNKARLGSRVRRRTITPVAVVVIVGLAVFIVTLSVLPIYPEARQPFLVAVNLLTLATPLAMVAGLARGQSFAAFSVGRVAMRARHEPMTPAAVQAVIADALGDPTLRLGLWDSERAAYLDVAGVPIELPANGSNRQVTRVTRDEQHLAALIHDPAFDADAEVLEGLAATSLMLLENTRLVEELRASRARLVETGARERRRIEKDLHDGAQQRLIGIQIRLARASELADRDDLVQQLDATQNEAESALEELRELSHGVYPVLLADHGLAAALRSVGSNSSLPIQVHDEGVERSSDVVEAAVYFCAREAIQNAAKHAGSGATVTVTLARRNGAIEFAVSDDGAGMPPLDGELDGGGLVGMRDRIETVNGWLDVVSAPGEGTTVRGRVPIR